MYCMYVLILLIIFKALNGLVSSYISQVITWWFSVPTSGEDVFLLSN